MEGGIIMVKIESMCMNCDRKEICKYCESMNKLVKVMNDSVSKLGANEPFHDAPFSIPRIDCDYFEASKPNTKGW